MDKNQWYERRQDRINRVENVSLNYQTTKPIGVIVSTQDINRYSNQLMTIISINILSRWCNNISIELERDVECCLPNYSGLTLKEAINNVVYNNDPYGSFQILEKINEPEYEYFLIVGETEQIYSGKLVYIDSYNWIYGISNSNLHLKKLNSTNVNPVGPTLASCAGVAILFKYYIENESIVPFRKFYSLYDFTSSHSFTGLSNPEIPSNINVGKIYQIGCGAVGSCFDYLLSCTDFSGKVFLIDFDFVKIENIPSSLVFNYQDAKEGIQKIYACERTLENNKSINISVSKLDYAGFIRENNYSGEDYPDCILCLANEKNIWSTIQYNLPPLVLHATTSTNWVANFGRHIPFKDWCIVCRFGIENYEYIPKCSTGIIKKNLGKDNEPLGALPFLSPTSAVLILAELIKKESYSQYPINPENFIQYSMNFNKMNEFILLKKNRNKSCPVCKSLILEDYPEHFKDKFINLIV